MIGRWKTFWSCRFLSQSHSYSKQIRYLFQLAPFSVFPCRCCYSDLLLIPSFCSVNASSDESPKSLDTLFSTDSHLRRTAFYTVIATRKPPRRKPVLRRDLGMFLIPPRDQALTELLPKQKYYKFAKLEFFSRYWPCEGFFWSMFPLY